MKSTDNAKNLIKEFEGLRLTKYTDYRGFDVVGYGHRGKNLPKTITKDQANKYLDKDISIAESKVNKYRDYSFNQNQFDALVSFAYNIGSIDQLTANGTRTVDQIGKSILLYVYSGSTKLKGLVARRQKEYELFFKDIFITTCETTGKVEQEVITYSWKTDKEKKLSDNFQVKEFIGNNTPLRDMYEYGKYTSLLISSKLVNYTQQIRNHFNAPVIISSGYRPTEYNKSVNGATSSYHILGKAADIYIKGVSINKLADYCKSIGILGVGIYSTFVHIDTRNSKYYWKG